MPSQTTATTAAAASRARAAQQAQAGLGAAIASLLERAWQRVDPERLDETLPTLFRLVEAIVRRYAPASGALASRFYLEQRRAAGIKSPFSVRLAAAPNTDEINRTVGWATAPLRGEKPDLELAKSQLQGAIDRLVLGVGRATIIDNTKRDRQATGWARVPEAGCCSFCALLASRGAVYKEAAADFRAHDHCRCHAEPVFRTAGYEPSAEIREWQALYDLAKGGSAKAVRRKFRRLYDEARALQLTQQQTAAA